MDRDDTIELLEEYITMETIVALGDMIPEKIPEDGVTINLFITSEGVLETCSMQEGEHFLNPVCKKG
jgi:hypothetical protein